MSAYETGERTAVSATATDEDHAALSVRPGDRLGRYDLVSVIGAGGMGVVFEARDPDLDRAVAVKVLSSPSRSTGPGAARLRREGVTMARLTHPNVVRVYDVGIARGHAFVAMELIRGCSLATWLELVPRTSTEIIAAFEKAGRGLAAAHAAGLVHRDFKPQNVVVGDDGRVLVTDFGLARMIGDSEPSATQSRDGWSASDIVTAAGEVVGTPAYMAPEQRNNSNVDARADQYSFCLALWMSLCRSHGASEANPRTGTTLTGGGRRGIAIDRLLPGVPRRLHKTLARGLQIDSARRFPSMHELLTHLEAGRSRPRGAWIVAGAVGLAGVAAALLFPNGATTPQCPAPTERLSAVWSPERRRSLATHMLDIDSAQGRSRFDATARVIDPLVGRWSTLHVEACKDTRVRRTQPDLMLDRTMVCLDRTLAQLDETINGLQRAKNRFGLDEAMSSVSALSGVDACADTVALSERPPPPTDPEQRARYNGLLREIASLDARRRIASERPLLEEELRGAIERARALGHPVLLGDSLWNLAMLQIETHDLEPAMNTLREHATVAATAKDDRMVAETMARLVVLTSSAGRLAEAEDLLLAAKAAMARGRVLPTTRAIVLQAESRIARTKGDLGTASKLLTDAIAVLEGSPADDATVSSALMRNRMELATLQSLAGNWPQVAATYRVIIPEIVEDLGRDHPQALTAHFNLGVSLMRLGDNVGAHDAFFEAVRIGETRLPPSPRLSDLLAAVGGSLVLIDRADEAVPVLERALEMARDTMSPDDPRLVDSVTNLGAALITERRFDDARRYVEEAVAMRETSGKVDYELAGALQNLANLRAQTDDCEAALEPIGRALAIYERSSDKLSVEGLLNTRNLFADCQVDLERWDAAAATSQQVLTSNVANPKQRAIAHMIHGQAVAGSGRTVLGINEVRMARDEMAALGLPLDVVDEWLAARTRRTRR
jgi:eukaryotic-like serine/threonine-protein kinase